MRAVTGFVMTVLFSCTLTSCGQTSPESSNTQFYGHDNRRAELEFDGEMEVSLPPSYIQPVSELLNSYLSDRVKELINLQVQHLMGAFTEHPKFKRTPGSISGNPKITNIQATKGTKPGYARITYHFKDVSAFHKNLLVGNRKTIEFDLPRNVEEIFKRGIPEGGDENTCTDDHYNTEGDFWYFWNPYKQGCPLTKEDLVSIKGTLTALPATQDSYPDYNRLFEDGKVSITYLVGIDESFRESDLGHKSYKESIRTLKAKGGKLTLDKERQKRFVFSTEDGEVTIDMHLVDPNKTRFTTLAQQGMQESEVFIYDGHSGLGGHLDPDRFYDLTLPLNQYQIFYFNGCSTFTYYNERYFDLKSTDNDRAGSKNLDIITTTISAPFHIGSENDMSFISGLISSKRPSWQSIIDDIYETSGAEDSPLTNVNGDEDNPRKPR